MKRAANIGRITDEHGESGISPMLLLITVLLVAGSAGALFITTNNELATQAFNTNQHVQTYVSSQYHIMAVIIVDVDLDQDVDQLYLTTKLGSGSKALSFLTTGITLSNPDFRAELIYTSDLNGEDSTHFNCEMPSIANAGSGTSGLITDPVGSFSLDDPTLSRETIVQIHIDLVDCLGTEASPGDQVHLRIVTDRSSPTYVMFQIPEVIETTITHLK
ncbi:MAG: hypothetical protein U9R75_01770 [Candidatus Thermoplasmatota archaeon]|nr:hypothetical protein [Candidatus Thermoplasmatota archaeon]